MNQNDQAFFFAGFIHANRDCLARRDQPEACTGA